MDSIVKRKNKYSVVYAYIDENGKKRQKWETFETNADARKRKAQIEFEQETGTFIVPEAKTVSRIMNICPVMLSGKFTSCLETLLIRRSNGS